MNADYLAHKIPLFKNLKILNVQQLFIHQYACLMWDFKHKNLHECFDSYFKNLNEVHDHYTRSAANSKLSECGLILYTKTQFKHFGVKIHKSINDLDFLRKSNRNLVLRKNIRTF